MHPARSRSLESILRPAMGLFAAAAMVAGCVGSGSSGSSGPSSSASPSAAPSSPVSVDGFYLRASRTQALSPQYTFSWLPVTTISDGQYFSGNVAVPAIYPGPAYIEPASRSISAKGIAAIIAEAYKDGLLGTVTGLDDGIAPGSIVCRVQITIDGKTSNLAGPCSGEMTSGSPAPGSAGAFQSFWNQVTSLDGWLADELGQGVPFKPVSIGVLIAPPTEASAGVTPTETPWPLTSTFATFGASAGSTMRCGTVKGADLEKLLLVVKASNSLTRFVDSTGAKVSLQVRAVLPGETDPCR